MKDLISSPSNPLIKRLRSLKQRKFREREGSFLVEGIEPVWAAVEKASVETIVVSPDLLTSESARQMVENVRAKGVQIVKVRRAVFDSIAERENPSGIAAIVRMFDRDIYQLPVAGYSTFVALHEVGNPGNLGAIIRTADAVGASGVILIGETTDEYHPNAVKASTGALFNVLIVHIETLDTLFGWCASHRLTLVTTSAHAKQNYTEVPYELPAVFLFGSEGEGLSEEMLARGDLAVRIPMSGTATSLNLAVAVGVLLYEVKRMTEQVYLVREKSDRN